MPPIFVIDVEEDGIRRQYRITANTVGAAINMAHLNAWLSGARTARVMEVRVR